MDGAGKSTVLKRVAERLRSGGTKVFLPRSGNEHDSRPTRMIRRLTRDQRNLDLSGLGEMLLYCAREAQVLEELVRPALRRGETVLIDRSLLTPEVLGRARGLDATQCREIATLSAGGLEPDLTLVFEVHTSTSKLRKRVEKVRTHVLDGEGGRKGLAGSGFKQRVRDLYITIAKERGYPLFHVERATPDELEARVTRVIEHGASADLGQGPLDETPLWRVDAGLPFLEALETLPLAVALPLSQGLRMGRLLRQSAMQQEPGLVAWGLDEEDPIREAMFEVEPRYALRGLRKSPFLGNRDLRMRMLGVDPTAALSSLRYQLEPEFDLMRERHVESAPDGVLKSLAGREDAFAVDLRARCWKAGTDAARASSLADCTGEPAWKLRERLMDKHPIVGLKTVVGLVDPRVDRWLELYSEKAPKRVLAALSRRSDPFAYELREALFETGAEVIGSLRHLTDDRAMALRERAVSRWPAAVISSLSAVTGKSERPNAAAVVPMVERCKEEGAGDLFVARQLQSREEWPGRPAWATTPINQSETEL